MAVEAEAEHSRGIADETTHRHGGANMVLLDLGLTDGGEENGSLGEDNGTKAQGAGHAEVDGHLLMGQDDQ
ncbi:hypothetical protein D3C76_837860 [compost metagenome]